MPFLADRKTEIPTKDILSWTFDDVKYDLDQPIYIDAARPERNISNRQARILVRQIAAGLHAAGHRPGDCVAIHSFNDIYYSILFLGILAAGGIFAGTNPSYTEFELIHHIETARTKFIITEPETLDAVRRAADKTGIAKERIWIFDVQGQAVPQGYKSWQSLLTHGERDWPRFNDLETCRTTPAARLFSSGTTGLPKAATLTHYNFIAQHTLVHEYADKPYTASRIFCIPMFHASSVPTAHTSALRAGTPTYVLRRFELEPLLASIEKFGITELAVVPPIVVAMLMSPATKKYSLKSIKAASCGAAPLAKETQQRFRELLSPDATVTQVWGMTETSCVASMIHYPGDDTTGSVGKLLPCVDAKLVDDEGKDISDYDVRGELCVRGPTIIPGYFENPKANAESYDGDGYFHTGDIAYLSAETGFWYIVDRKKELIKVRGFQVAPPELEAVLLSHPNIIDAAVIGVKDATDKDVEHPRAYVVARPGAPKPTEQEVKDFLNGKLAKYKALTGGVVFLEAIPKNPSGKILKRMLREMVEAEEKAKRAKL